MLECLEPGIWLCRREGGVGVPTPNCVQIKKYYDKNHEIFSFVLTGTHLKVRAFEVRVGGNVVLKSE